MKNRELVTVTHQVGHLPDALTFDTVNEIRQASMQLLANQVIDSFDLANVRQSDSAGLALLLDLLRFARQKRRKLTFINVPSHLNAFARVNGVDTLLF